jgi:hypothetical protein
MKTEIELNLELEKLKQTHGKVRELTVYLDTDDSSKVAVLFLRKPDRATRKMVNDLISKGKYDTAAISCLKALYLGGDSLDLIINNDDALESAGMGVVDLLEVQKAELKKN